MEHLRAAQAVENAKNIINIRKATHEFDVASLDLRVAEERRKLAEMQVEQAVQITMAGELDPRAIVASF